MLENIPFDTFNTDSRIVFFTGAGISAESGLATFRDPDGLWEQYDPMELASPQGFDEDPELVCRWYEWRRQTAMQASPNPGHLVITDFQKLFPQSEVITQNVDGLHLRAGNSNIWELHGNFNRFKCRKCLNDMRFDESQLLQACDCGGYRRPDVVWFGESLPANVIEHAFEAARNCDLFLSIGTSTQVYPAAHLPFEAKRQGAFVIEINPEPTPFTAQADLFVNQASGEALPRIFEEFNARF